MDRDQAAITDARTRFSDRRAAGRFLAQHLAQYRGKDTLVLGIPRGGVPVATKWRTC